jgi:hypothetical protein
MFWVYVTLHVCTFAVFWQSFIWLLQKWRLPHELFSLCNHAAVAAACSYTLSTRLPDVVKVLSLQYGNLEFEPENLLCVSWACFPVVLGSNFVAYFVVDMLNHSRYRRPFDLVDWLHHVLGIGFTLSGIAFESPNGILASLMGLQELSTMFLSLMSMGYKHIAVKLCFGLTFIAVRVLLGSFTALTKVVQHSSCPVLYAHKQDPQMHEAGVQSPPLAVLTPPWCDPWSLILTILTWMQLGMNTYFIGLMIRKVRKYATTAGSDASLKVRRD